MPRAHTEAERQRIHERLLRAGRQQFVRVGLRRATVAELARAAGIGKGSFYSFFASKEALFFAVQQREEAAFKGALLAETETAAAGADAVRALLLAATTRLDDHPFLRLLLDPDTLSALTLRLPAEQLDGHRDDDETFFCRLIERWQRRGWIRADLDPHLAFAVLGALFVVSTQHHIIDEAHSRRAARAIADAIVADWCPAPAAPT